MASSLSLSRQESGPNGEQVTRGVKAHPDRSVGCWVGSAVNSAFGGPCAGPWAIAVFHNALCGAFRWAVAFTQAPVLAVVTLLYAMGMVTLLRLPSTHRGGLRRRVPTTHQTKLSIKHSGT